MAKKTQNGYPWVLLGALAAVVAGCTISEQRGRKPRYVAFSAFCPSSSPPSCPDADREEVDWIEGVYYCYFDCALYTPSQDIEPEWGNWRVVFRRIYQPNLGEDCWVNTAVERIGECV